MKNVKLAVVCLLLMVPLVSGVAIADEDMEEDIYTTLEEARILYETEGQKDGMPDLQALDMEQDDEDAYAWLKVYNGGNVPAYLFRTGFYDEQNNMCGHPLRPMLRSSKYYWARSSEILSEVVLDGELVYGKADMYGVVSESSESNNILSIEWNW